MTTAERVVIVRGAMALLYGQFAGYSWVKRPEPDSRAWQIQDFRKDWRACCQFARKPDVQIQEPPDEALGAGVPRKGDPGSITQSSSALLLRGSRKWRRRSRPAALPSTSVPSSGSRPTV